MVLDLLKVTQSPPFPPTQCCTKPEEACQAKKTRNEQINLQPTLNKGGRCVSLTFLLLMSLKLKFL